MFGSFAAIIINALWVIGYLGGRIFGCRLPYAPFGWAALGLVLIIWGGLAWGYFIGRFMVETSEIEYRSDEVPAAFDGNRIVHISDLHVDSFNSKPQALQKIVDRVNALDADIILFTGDVTSGPYDDIPKHEQALKGFKACEGVVSVMGNHDFFIYDPAFTTDAERSGAADRLTRYERETLGWTVLRNESMILRRGQDSIAVAGVDNINGNQGFATIQKGDLSKAMTGLESVFTVLMSHDPSHWTAEVLPKSHAQITLSGHTHAAQVRIFGWSVANLAFDQCDGRYDTEDGRMLYVNAGIGCTAPFRIGCPSEITVITLKRPKK